MSLGARIKKVRRYLDLTQSEIGARIGIKPNSISLIESGNRNASEQVILSVCREFNVNETWLRTGEGPMFAEITEDEELAQIFSAIAVSDDALIKRIIRAYWKLNDNEKESVRKLIDGFSANANSKIVEENETLAPSTPDITQDVMLKLAEMEQQNKKLLARLEVLEKEEDEWEREQMKQSISPTRSHT